MRQRTRNFLSFIGSMVLLCAALFVAMDASADEDYRNQYQKQLQEAKANAKVDLEQTFTVNTELEFHEGDINTPDDITIRNTATGRAPSVYPSGNCYMGWSFGAGAPGANIGFGKAKLDTNCDARETARMFYQFGERNKAIQILCAQPAAAMLEDCKPDQDYNKEMKRLKATNELLFEDNSKLSDKIQSYCDESNDRVFAACVEK